MLERCLAPLALLGLLALATQAGAQAIPDGAGTLAGRDRLRVPGCGRTGGPLSTGFTLGANGAWTAVAGNATYTGTSTTMNGRLVVLTLDATSLTALDGQLETKASALCGEAVTISALSPKAALKVNKRQTRAALLVGVRATGSTVSGKGGDGTYRIRSRGDWTPVGT